MYEVRPSSKKIKTKKHLGNPTKFRSLCQELNQQPDVCVFTENAILIYTAITVHHGLGDFIKKLFFTGVKASKPKLQSMLSVSKPIPFTRPFTWAHHSAAAGSWSCCPHTGSTGLSKRQIHVIEGFQKSLRGPALLRGKKIPFRMI